MVGAFLTNLIGGSVAWGARQVSTALGLTGRKKGEIDDETHKWASFADTAYTRKKRDRHTKLDKHLGENHGWVLDNDNSTKHQTVFTKDDQTVTVFRGTDINDREDLHTDVALAVGMERSSKRFKHADRDFREVLDAYPDHTHIVVGHSLGGSLAVRMAEVYDVEAAHIFNPGSSVNAVKAGLKKPIEGEDNSHIHSYYIEGDGLSTLGRGDTSHDVNLIHPVKGSVNPHSLKQFLQ